MPQLRKYSPAKLYDGAQIATFGRFFGSCISSDTMCVIMLDMQSATAEIRRGKERKNDERTNHRTKTQWSALLYRATINITHCSRLVHQTRLHIHHSHHNSSMLRRYNRLCSGIRYSLQGILHSHKENTITNQVITRMWANA